MKTENPTARVETITWSGLEWSLRPLVFAAALLCGAAAPAGAQSRVPWTTLSTTTGDLPPPNGGSQQTSCVVADIDGDGATDFFITERSVAPSVILYRRQAGGWQKCIVEAGHLEIEAGGDAADIDGDGDLDVAFGQDSRGGNVWWWENPGAGLNPATPWVRRLIKSGGTQQHNQRFGDFDGDGRLEFATWVNGSSVVEVYEIPLDKTVSPWTRVAVIPASGEGMDVVDVDLDGKVDILIGGHWIRHDGGTTYSKQAIDSAYNFTQIVGGQFIPGGRPEILQNSADNSGPLNFYRYDGSAWQKTVLIAQVDHGHTLEIGDFDRDGHLDFFAAEMGSPGAGVNAKAWIGYGNGAGQFSIETIRTGLCNHMSRVADLDGDGDLDIVMKPYTQGAPRVDVLLNGGGGGGGTGLDNWLYKQVSAAHVRTFGLCFPNLGGDADLDIASGSFVYINPGSPLTGTWTQIALPNSVHAFATLDVDSDNLADLIASKDAGTRHDIYWVEAANVAGTAWATPILIGNLPRASHAEGSQGYRVAQIVAGGRSEIVLSTPQGIYYFSVPANPAGGNWPRTLVAANDLDEGIGVADIDGDGDLDLSFASEGTKQVKWARNPGDGSANWSVFTIGTFTEADFPDRCEAADLNGDGRVDIIVTEENTGSAADALACWWEQPASGATSANWTRHTIATQYTMNNLDVGDVDRDGDIDVVLAEHRGTKRIAVWQNNGTGVFAEKRVGEGNESHLGGRLVDLDGDGDLDLVSIAYDDFTRLSLWRNDNSTSTPGDTTRPTITSVTALNANTVSVLFSEPVTTATAQTPGNYGINNGVSVSGAVLGGDTRTVTLTTSTLAGGTYTLTVNNVADRATPANVIAANSQAAFSFSPSDTTRPTIASVTALNANTVSVLFSEPVATASAQTPGNYGINNGVSVSGAVLGGDTHTVTLTTSTLAGGTYTLTVNNVADRATPPNAIAANSQAPFGFTPSAPGTRVTTSLVVLYGFNESAGTTVRDVSGVGTPLDLTILDPARVQWVGGGGTGLRFVNAGSAVRSPGPGTKIHSALMATGRVTLEAWVTPANLTQNGPARIVTVSEGTATDEVNMHLGQGGDGRSGDVGSSRVRTSADSFNWLQAGGVFSSTVNPRHVVVTYDGATQRIYVDGVEHSTSQGLTGNFSNWNSAYPFVLGNEATLNRSWLGTLHLVAVYNRALSSAEILENRNAGPSLQSTPADTTRPTITSVMAVNGTTVQGLFSEPVAELSAETLVNYSINNCVNVTAAVLGADLRTVTLTTSALAGGSYTLTVNNVTDRATTPNSIVANSQIAFGFTSGDKTYEQWRQVYFTCGELSDPAVSGETCDPDGDRISNLMEYALGLNPRVANDPGRPAARIENGFLVLSCTRNKEAADVVLDVEAATLLAGPWSAAGLTQQVISDDGVIQTIKVIDSVAVGVEASRFLRLTVQFR